MATCDGQHCPTPPNQHVWQIVNAMKMFHCDVVIASSETIAKHIYNNTGNLTPNRITTTIRPRIRRATTVTKIHECRNLPWTHGNDKVEFGHWCWCMRHCHHNKNLHGDSAIALRPAGDTEGSVRQHTTHSRPGPSWCALRAGQASKIAIPSISERKCKQHHHSDN